MKKTILFALLLFASSVHAQALFQIQKAASTGPVAAYVQGCNGSNGGVSTIACTPSGNVTNGDIIACFGDWDTSLTLSGIAKSSGTATVGTFNDWGAGGTTLTAVISTTFGSTMGYAQVTGTGTATLTLTVTGGTGNLRIICHDISGGAVSSPKDSAILVAQSSPGTGTNGVTTTPAQTTTQNGDYLFGVCYDIGGNASSVAAGTGYTLRDNVSAARTTESQIQAASSASTVATYTTTGGGGDVWFVGVMAFKP